MTPDTVLRWYRQLVAKKYDGSKRRGLGRPVTKVDIAGLVVKMAKENRGWGYTRIRGGLKSLGHDIARNTVKQILKDNGIEPVLCHDSADTIWAQLRGIRRTTTGPERPKLPARLAPLSLVGASGEAPACSICRHQCVSS